MASSFQISALNAKKPTEFSHVPDKATLKAIAEELNLISLAKLRFEGKIFPDGKSDWQVTGHLGATVTQPCVITLDPVVTRLEEDVVRRFVKDYVEPEDAEFEMPDDDSLEALGATLDIAKIATEALVLALPLYPRGENAALPESTFAADGVTPLSDEAVKPFAGLAELKKRIEDQS